MVKVVVAVAKSRQMLEAAEEGPTMIGRGKMKTLELSPDDGGVG